MDSHSGRVPGGCGRLSGWTTPPQKRLMSTSLGRSTSPCHQASWSRSWTVEDCPDFLCITPTGSYWAWVTAAATKGQNEINLLSISSFTHSICRLETAVISSSLRAFSTLKLSYKKSHDGPVLRKHLALELKDPTSDWSRERLWLCRVFDADLFTLPRIWKEIQENVDYRTRQKSIADFNKSSAWRKRGMSLTPCR